MRKNCYLLLILIIGLIGCSTQHSIQISTATDIPITPITVSSTSKPTIEPTPTYNYRCWEKEKECEIAESLGISIQSIDSFSPNMQWVVIYDGKMEDALPDGVLGGMRFAKVDGSIEWKFDETQMSQDIGECSNIFITNFWSNDSKYVYFSPDPSFCSRMFNFSDIGTQVLYRLAVETGVVEEYLPFVRYRFSSGHERWGLYTFRISPDGNHLIYFQSYSSPMVIKIRNLTTEHEETYELNSKYLEAGCPAWMDDSVHVLFYAATTTRPNDPTSASLFIINLDEKTIQTIYHDQPNVYCPHSSDSYFRDGNPDVANLIPVRVLDIGYAQVIDQFYLNPLTGQNILWATITPYPSNTPKP